MTYCNQEIHDKSRRKRKQPSVSLCALDKERREAELEEYRKNTHIKMTIMFSIPESGGKVNWPTKLR